MVEVEIMTPEGRVKAKVKAILDKYEVYHFWPVQTGMGGRTLDCIGCVAGYFFSIETKAPGGKPTKFQEHTIREMKRRGAYVFVIDSVDSPQLFMLEVFIRARQMGADVPVEAEPTKEAP